jgi:signal transduction histidine kinase/ActR/RegA family two-component response regulator
VKIEGSSGSAVNDADSRSRNGRPDDPASARAVLPDRLWTRVTNLQARITAIAMLPAITLAVLVGGLSISLRQSDLGTGLQQRGLLLARQLASAADYGVFSGNRIALQTLAESVAGEKATLAVQILDSDGSVLASVGLMPPGAGAAPSDGRSVEHEDWWVFRESIRSPRIPIDDLDLSAPPAGALQQSAPAPAASAAAGRVAGTALVVLSTADIRLEARRFAATVIGILVLVLIVTGLFARRMSRRLSRPVVEIAQAVERIGRGDTGVRVAPSRIGVVALLAHGVNEMAARLERSLQDLEQRVQEATHQLLDKKEEAENANRAKSRFLAAASHDLRQPMHALGMFVATLAQQPSTPLQRQLIAQIDRAVGAMGDLLDSLLDISRLDAGVIETRIGLVPLRPVLERIGNEFATVAQTKGIELVVRRTSLWVRSDRILLERILVNLLSNAVRYTEQGRIVLAARVCGPDRNEVRIEVRDSGPGIPDDAREAIFQEFVQLGNPERDRGKGLGLGLAIVKRLTNLLDHRLQLRSAPGKGSTFGVIVPRVSEEEVARAEAAAARLAMATQLAAASRAGAPPGARPARQIRVRARPPGRQPAEARATAATDTIGGPDSPDGRGESGIAPTAVDAAQTALQNAARPFTDRRILVVDDDPMVRESLATILKSWGAMVATSSGQPSLPKQLGDADRPDLILCDLRLGQDVDGVQMLAAIRAELGSDLPAVLITGDTDPERTAFAMSSGDPVLHKPVRPAQLRALIRNLLRKQDEG